MKSFTMIRGNAVCKQLSIISDNTDIEMMTGTIRRHKIHFNLWVRCLYPTSRTEKARKKCVIRQRESFKESQCQKMPTLFCQLLILKGTFKLKYLCVEGFSESLVQTAVGWQLIFHVILAEVWRILRRYSNTKEST